MKSFRQELTKQIERIPKGRIFTAKDLTFDVSKTANVNVLLAELVKKGRIKRIEKGAYYRFGMMKYGLGPKPIYQEEKIRYILSKTGGYLSGYYAYNLMGLTEQVPTVITIATPNPVRAFRFVNLRFNCIKACKGNFKPDEVEYLRVLDVVNHIKHVPGISHQILIIGFIFLFACFLKRKLPPSSRRTLNLIARADSSSR